MIEALGSLCGQEVAIGMLGEDRTLTGTLVEVLDGGVRLLQPGRLLLIPFSAIRFVSTREREDPNTASRN